MVSDLQDFHDSQQQLTTWLAQKDKMLTVLGPLATDKAMINNQQEQVKVS